MMMDEEGINKERDCPAMKHTSHNNTCTQCIQSQGLKPAALPTELHTTTYRGEVMGDILLIASNSLIAIALALVAILSIVNKINKD